MPKITIKNREGEETIIDAEVGMSLMQNILDAGYDEMLALCGGSCACATCHVYIDHTIESIGQPVLDETELLAISPNKTVDSRLSCQVLIAEEHEGLKVTLAPED